MSFTPQANSILGSLKCKHCDKAQWPILFCLFVSHLFSYLQSKKLVNPALPLEEKGILHFSGACFFNVCSSTLVCNLQRGGEKQRII